MEFTENFYSCRKRRATASDLFQLRQHKNESLREFCARFNLTMNEIHHLHVSVALPAFLKATTNLNLIGSLSKSEPTSLSELVARQQKYIQQEEAICSYTTDPMEGDVSLHAERRMDLGHDKATGKRKLEDESGSYESKKHKN